MNLPVIDRNGILKRYPQRHRDSHKGMFGSVVVIGGATGMTGAALLASRAALKLGAGSVHAMLLADHAPVVDFVQPELMLHDKGAQIPDATVIAIGCGIGKSRDAQEFTELALRIDKPLVIDADALNLLALHADLRSRLAMRRAATVLTPHPGEAARLLSCSIDEIQQDRMHAAQSLFDLFGCPLVLKGASSLCRVHDGLYLNDTGNPGMSAPGMGDVLAGMIAALIAQGMSADDALLLAVHLHGAAGDELAARGIAIGMTAGELADCARELLNLWISR